MSSLALRAEDEKAYEEARCLLSVMVALSCLAALKVFMAASRQSDGGQLAVDYQAGYRYR